MVISTNKVKSVIIIKDLEYKSCIKYLGIFLDDKLNWNMQIKHIKTTNKKYWQYL